MLPNYIVIGAAKCGTTSMCDLLGRHPDVFMSEPKEPSYFSHMEIPSKTREWYEALFAAVTTEKAVGEGSTSYTHPDVIRETATQIRRTIPDCRLVYMVRQPIKRLESDWRMRRHEGWTPESINDAVREQVNLVRHGFYWSNLSVYREHFPDDQILVVFLEDFSRDPNGELSRCFAHIGVNPAVRLADAGRARNRGADLRADSGVAARLRRWRHFDGLKRAVPRWIVDAGKSVLTRRESFTVEWDPALRREVAAQFREEAAPFLAHCGKPAEYWTID